jgi:hypothetical protein
MRRAFLSLALVFAGASASSDARAWDTYVNGRNDWYSIYQNVSGGTGSYSKGHHDARGNEHAEITDATLYAMNASIGDRFGVHAALQCNDPKACPETPTLVDLNASFMRPELYGNDTYGDDVSTPLEERRLPPLAMWAGLPDFNYTVYDWINKSTRCPALPLDADRYELCHMYSAWLGAAMNSSHWGELAVKIYRRHHAIALRHAARAAALRKLLRTGGKPKTLPIQAQSWYADYVREAEMLALIYEVTGQHFLQDRWAIGHMFSRWGPGSYEEMTRVSQGKPDLDQITNFGVLTGIVHGSLAVFGKPDPLNAPLIDYELFGHDDAKVMKYRWAAKNKLFKDPEASEQFGLGDYFFADVIDDKFDGSVLRKDTSRGIAKIDKPKPVKALTQRKALNTCGGDGLRHVIASFDPASGGYGEFGIPLTPANPNDVLPGATVTGSDPASNQVCTDVWATNDSYYDGVRTMAGASWLLGEGLPNDLVAFSVAKGQEIGQWLKEAFGLVPDDPTYTPSGLRVIVPYTRVLWRSWVNKKHDEVHAKTSVVRYGVDSAKVGSSFRNNSIDYRPNTEYQVPAYFEPEDVDSLPWWSETTENGKMPAGGKDRAAIDGFFNKARTERWCNTLYGEEKESKTEKVTLKLLRTQGLELSVAAKNEKDPKKKAALNDEAKRARATCAYLANRVYKATDPMYPESGSRFERIGDHLPLGGAPKFGPSYEPICAYFDGGGASDIRTPNASDDDKPYFIRPGYVSTPGAKGAWGHSPKTLESWCSMVPVLDVGQLQDHPDAVGEVVHDDGDRRLKINGENLGIKTGGGKVGKVVAVDANGVKQSLEIRDTMQNTETGGWSYDNQTVWTRMPGSLKGFDTHAQASMPPHEIKKLAPKIYKFELVRPDDPSAKSLYRADGQKTVGTYEFLLHTSWVEHTGIVANGVERTKGVWVTYPAWIRPQSVVLVNAFFSVQNNVYEPINLAAAGVTVEVVDGAVPVIDAQGNVTWSPDPDKRGIAFSHPVALPPQVFDGTVAFFFAFH